MYSSLLDVCFLLLKDVKHEYIDLVFENIGIVRDIWTWVGVTRVNNGYYFDIL